MRKRRNKQKPLRKAKKVRRIPLRVIFLFFLLVLFFSAALHIYKLIASSDYFKVSGIDSNVKINAEVKKIIKGKTLFEINIKEIHNRILKKHPEFRTVQIEKLFPSKLKIKVVRRMPFAQIKKDGFYTLDEECMVLNEGRLHPSKDLLIIELGDYRKIIKKGKFIDDQRLKLVFELVGELKKLKL